MGLSAVYAYKISADAAYARGDVEEGNRLMRKYNEAIAQAEKDKIRRKIEAAKREQKALERKKAELKKKQVK